MVVLSLTIYGRNIEEVGISFAYLGAAVNAENNIENHEKVMATSVC